MYISAMVFEIGVPVAKTMPPPRSARYRVFMYISRARLLSVFGKPGDAGHLAW